MAGPFQGKRGYNNRPGFANNGVSGRNGGNNNGKGVLDSSTAAVICQIYFKLIHTIDLL